MAITANPTVQAGAVIVGKGIKTALNLSADTVVKSVKGRIAKVSVLTAGSAPGFIYDAATVGTASAANLLAAVPNVVGVYDIDMPAATGIVYVHGTAQVVAISYN